MNFTLEQMQRTHAHALEMMEKWFRAGDTGYFLEPKQTSRLCAAYRKRYEIAREKAEQMAIETRQRLAQLQAKQAQ